MPTPPERSGGRIVLVGTPLGNLGDMAPRGAEALASADCIACEDTRRTGRLLAHLGISGPRLIRMDSHTETDVADDLIDAVNRGAVVAVVSDAGMPGLSDPGGRLVAAAATAGLCIEAVPGPFAGAIAAVLSGLLDPTGRFTFEGFLPRRGADRASRLAELAAQERPSIIYESPHRVTATIDDLVSACGPQRRVAISRELTKLHEETWRGSLGEAAAHFAQNPPRGEFVLVLSAAPPPSEATDDQIRTALAARIEAGDTRRDAAAAVAAELAVGPNRVKRLANS